MESMLSRRCLLSSVLVREDCFLTTGSWLFAGPHPPGRGDVCSPMTTDWSVRLRSLHHHGGANAISWRDTLRAGAWTLTSDQDLLFVGTCYHLLDRRQGGRLRGSCLL